MNEKARAHETLAMLIGAMGAEHDSAARKRVEDLREYVTSLESEWQPIDTAPKDGTPILAFGSDEQFTVKWGKVGFHREGWRLISYGDHAEDIEEYPTHWKPLGPNPEAA